MYFIDFTNKYTCTLYRVGTSRWHILHVDQKKMRQYILILMVPLDSFKNITFWILVKIFVRSWHYQLPFLQCDRFPGNIKSRRTAIIQTSKQNPSYLRSELIVCTSIFHGNTLCLFVLQLWDVFQSSRTPDKLSSFSFAQVLFIFSGSRPLWRNDNW